jgi:4-hydroxy-tetrahydrodipicolinate synthase
MSLETMSALAKLPRIIGVKDATGDLGRPLHARLTTGENFTLLSGDDATALAFLAQGGDGLVSVTSNIAPKLCAAMQRAWRSGAVKEAQRINQLLAPFNRALFLETNPSPVKYAASVLGLSTADVRLPLCAISDTTRTAVREAMARADLLSSEACHAQLSSKLHRRRSNARWSLKDSGAIG